MRKLKLIFGFLFVISVAGVTKENFWAVPFALALGIYLIYSGFKTPKSPKKGKKKWHRFSCEVKGHFLPERQRILFRIYKDFYNKDFSKFEIYARDRIEFVEEPDNEYDPNAIAIYAKGYGQIGYVPRNQTQELREAIHLDKDFRSYLTVYNMEKEYFADILVEQKYRETIKW